MRPPHAARTCRSATRCEAGRRDGASAVGRKWGAWFPGCAERNKEPDSERLADGIPRRCACGPGGGSRGDCLVGSSRRSRSRLGTASYRSPIGASPGRSALGRARRSTDDHGARRRTPYFSFGGGTAPRRCSFEQSAIAAHHPLGHEPRRPRGTIGKEPKAHSREQHGPGERRQGERRQSRRPRTRRSRLCRPSPPLPHSPAPKARRLGGRPRANPRARRQPGRRRGGRVDGCARLAREARVRRPTYPTLHARARVLGRASLAAGEALASTLVPARAESGTFAPFAQSRSRMRRSRRTAAHRTRHLGDGRERASGARAGVCAARGPGDRGDRPTIPRLGGHRAGESRALLCRQTGRHDRSVPVVCRIPHRRPDDLRLGMDCRNLRIGASKFRARDARARCHGILRVGKGRVGLAPTGHGPRPALSGRPGGARDRQSKSHGLRSRLGSAAPCGHRRGAPHPSARRHSAGSSRPRDRARAGHAVLSPRLARRASPAPWVRPRRRPLAGPARDRSTGELFTSAPLVAPIGRQGGNAGHHRRAERGQNRMVFA